MGECSGRIWLRERWEFRGEEMGAVETKNFDLSDPVHWFEDYILKAHSSSMWDKVVMGSYIREEGAIVRRK
jgi:hypothetical protein